MTYFGAKFGAMSETDIEGLLPSRQTVRILQNVVLASNKKATAISEILSWEFRFIKYKSCSLCVDLVASSY